MDELQEYKDLYHDELNLHNSLNSKLTNSITFLTIIGTAETLLLKEIFPLSFDSFSIIYYTICVENIIIFSYTIYYFIKAFTGHAYSYFCLTNINKQCVQFKKDIIIQNPNIDENSIEPYLKDIRFKMIIEMYYNCTVQNRKTNTQKSNCLLKFTSTIILNMVFVFGSFMVYLLKINIGGLIL